MDLIQSDLVRILLSDLLEHVLLYLFLLIILNVQILLDVQRELVLVHALLLLLERFVPL